MKKYVIVSVILALSTSVVLTGCAPSASNGKAHETPQAQSSDKQDATKTQVKNQAEKPDYKLERTDLGQGLYMLKGRGGNLGVSVGDDGVFLIDDQYADHAPAILDEIAAISKGPIRFVANTHYHGDHTGGNIALGETGASIVAHDNVRRRMSQDQENKLWGRTTLATSPEAWPGVTFSQNLTFHFNGQTIEVQHVPIAHTDGDSIVYFREADVLHMGDNFFNGLFPYIDIDAGGSVDGMISALDKGLSMAGPQTKIIPGHGPLSTRAEMQAARDMLADVQNRVKTRIEAGAGLDTILREEILSDYSHLASFINEENMVRISFRSLTGQIE